MLPPVGQGEEHHEEEGESDVAEHESHHGHHAAGGGLNGAVFSPGMGNVPEDDRKRLGEVMREVGLLS